MPLEAPFKLCNALYNATLKSDEFDPALNIFQRIRVAITREDFLHSTTFYAKNEYKVELLGNLKNGEQITDEFRTLGNIIKTDIERARETKTNSQHNPLQKELKYSNIAGSRFAAKVMLGKKSNNRNVNGIGNF